MIGVVVEVADLVKIWSIFPRRLISYGREDVPRGCGEGDWIEIDYDESGVMRGSRMTNSDLKTRRDKRGKLQILDFFLLDPARNEAFSESFGVVTMEGRDGWVDEREAIDHCYQLWLTVGSDARFVVEEQSLFRLYARESEYADTFQRLERAARRVRTDLCESSSATQAGGRAETVVVVGFNPSSASFFTSSRAGEALLVLAVWRRHGHVQIGDVFSARLELGVELSGGVDYVVSELLCRRPCWEGVEMSVLGNELKMELDGEVVERRATCCVLETAPLGAVTYPLDRGQKGLPTNVAVGDRLRVRITRFKNASRDDHPSKWQATSLVRALEPGEKVQHETERPRASSDSGNRRRGDAGGFVETIFVIQGDGRRFFCCSPSGESMLAEPVCRSHGDVRIGAVFRAKLREAEDPSFECKYAVTELIERLEGLENALVQVNERNDLRVELEGTIGERRATCCTFHTDCLGIVTYPMDLNRKAIPEDVKDGEWMRVRVSRFRYGGKPDHPSKWQVTSVIRREHERSKFVSVQTSKKGWVEGVVTGRSGARCFISFQHGNAVYADTRGLLSLGSVVDMAVCSTGNDSFFAVDELDEQSVRRSSEIQVETAQFNGSTTHLVRCGAVVARRAAGLFVLECPLIGAASLPYARTPFGMAVGQRWRVKLYRLKHRRELPSNWVVHSVLHEDDEYEATATTTMPFRSEERRRRQASPERAASTGGAPWTDADRAREKPRDRRALDLMHRIMNDPVLVKKFQEVDPKSLMKIETILQRDREKFH